MLSLTDLNMASSGNSPAANSSTASSPAAKPGDEFADGFGDESGDSFSNISGDRPGDSSSDSPGGGSGDSTNVCCYFKDKDGKLTWQWGLVPGTNAWLSVPGNWEQGGRMGGARFVANGSVNEARILEAAVTAQNYYKLQEYQLVAIFAAMPGAARDCPLVVQGKELYPGRWRAPDAGPLASQ
jgi:hypothetical protein